jgi:LSD1 subclass zinc finger protein
MAVQMICPNLRCRKFLTVPDGVRGKLVKCQYCQTTFRVPDAKKPDPTAKPAKV